MTFTPFYKLKKNPLTGKDFSDQYKEVIKKVKTLPSNKENIQII